MLKGLFGSKDKELVLQFILSKKEAYASQIATFFELKTPQIRAQLELLERESILESNYVGTIKIYKFSEKCSFVEELKWLLIKARETYETSLTKKLSTLEDTKTTKTTKKSPTGYFSGTIALNLFPDDNNGDWHSSMAQIALERGHSKSPYFIMGRQGRLSTKKYFKEDGIVDVSNTIAHITNKTGIVKAAKPYRAIADMLLISFLKDKRTDHIQVDDWLTDPHGQNQLKRMLTAAAAQVPSDVSQRITLWASHHL